MNENDQSSQGEISSERPVSDGTFTGENLLRVFGQPPKRQPGEHIFLNEEVAGKENKTVKNRDEGKEIPFFKATEPTKISRWKRMFKRS